MTYTIIITYFHKSGKKDVYTYEHLDKIMRDVWLEHAQEYAQDHASRYTGYAVKTLSYNAKGKLVKTVTACKVFLKYGATVRTEAHGGGEAMRFYSNNLEQIIRDVRNAITGKGSQAHGYVQETDAYREKTGTGTDIVVNNISGTTRY